MTVYVDDMHRYPLGRFQRMKMSHLIADSNDELHAFADSIGLKREWFQQDHYDVSLTKRREAVQKGAVEVTLRVLSLMARERRRTGRLPRPEEVSVALNARP